MSEKLRVLVVDDDAAILPLVARFLRKDGFEVLTTDSPMGVSNLVRSVDPDIVLLDLMLPAVPGDQLLSLARRAARPDTRFVLFSSCDVDALRSAAERAGADGWLSKSAVGRGLGPALRAAARLAG